MIRKTIHFCSKTTLLVFEIFLVLVVILAMGFALLFARFSQGPVDVTWAQPYIQHALSDDASETRISFGGVVAQWEEFTGPITLGVSDIRVAHKGREEIVIPKAGISLAKAPLLFGKIAPVAVIVTAPKIHVVRNNKGQFRLALMNAPSSQDSQVAESETPPFDLSDMGNRLFLGGRIMPSTSLTWLSELETLRIEKARLVAEDHVSGITWTIKNVDLDLNRRKNALDTNISFETPSQEGRSVIHFKAQRTQAGITTDIGIKNFDVTLVSRNIMALSLLQGRHVVIDGNFQSQHQLDWGLQSLSGKIDTKGSENAGRFLTVKAVPRDDRSGIDVSFQLDNILIDDVARLWPKEQWADLGITPWVTQQLSKGVFENITVTLPLDKTPTDIPLEQRITARFDFKELSVDYRAPLTPISEAQGSGIMKDDRLEINVTSAKLGNMAIAKGDVVITNLTKPTPGMATITIDLLGAVPDVLNYIALEPIALKDQVGIDPAAAKGQADMKVKVEFPAVKDLKAEDVTVDVSATLKDVVIPSVIGRADLTGGPFDLLVDGGAFTLKGQGFLGGQPVDLTYQEYLNPDTAPFSSKITAKVMTSSELRDKLNVNLTDYIDGNAPVEIDYTQDKDGEVVLNVTADVTPAKVFVTPLGFEKPPGRAGKATATVLMQKDEVREIKDLNIEMGNDVAKGGRLVFGKVGAERDIVSGQFANINLNKTSIFSLSFKNTVNLLSVTLKGQSMDARPFLHNDAAGMQTLTKAIQVTANTQKMRTGDAADQLITNPSLSITVDKNNAITNLDLNAQSGSGNLRAQITPNAQGVMELNISASDAGATLNNFGIYDTLRGGALAVRGQQIKGAGLNDIAGQAEISNFRVIKAPVLAQMINAFSLSGLGNLLGNEGIEFKNLRAQFSWRDTQEGRVINITNGRTAGASIGLTFGGLINQDKNTIDMSGTFVPVSEVNKIVSRIPIVGELLTGGRNGGIIAATYAVKGNTDNPRVIINPLSVLAPGFLRSILFETTPGPEPAATKAPARRQANQ